MSKTWYQIQAKSNDEASIDIHAEIGAWGISSTDFLRDLRGLGEVKQIRISIDSPGGSVFDAYSIANALMKHPATVTAEVAGMAASAASYIACAADKLIMPENSWLMIHQPWTVAIGDSDDMRETADFLDRQGDKIMRLCAAKAGMNQEQLEAMIADSPGKELWLDGLQAEELGFADEVINRIEVFAKFDTSRFVMTPKSLQANSDTDSQVAPVDETAPAPVEPVAPVEASAEAEVEQPAPEAEVEEATPQASLIQRAIAALTGRPDTSAVQAKLDEANTLVATLHATNASLTARISELEPLAQERNELLAAIQTVEASAVAQVAALGFNPDKEADLPTAGDDKPKPSFLEQFNALTGAERTAFYNAHKTEIFKAEQAQS